MRLVTAKQMQDLDHLAITKFKIPSLTLMENAGRGLFEVLRNKFPDLKNKKILIVAGKGNNGGDGFVLGRYLAGHGCAVQIWLLAESQDLSPDAKKNYDKLNGSCFGAVLRLLRPSRTSSATQQRTAPEPPVCYDIIIDAILGTGLSNLVQSPLKEAIVWMNQQKAFKVAVDIPSGLNADDGKIMGVAVKADLTVTLGLPKRGLFLADGLDCAGAVLVADIGLPEEAIHSLFNDEGNFESLISPSDLYLTPRPRNSHKGANGHVLLVAGSKNKLGAALMTAKAALRSGSGLVTLALPEAAFEKIPSDFLELMYEPLPSNKMGEFSVAALAPLQKIIEGKDVIAVGPGMGTGEGAKALVTYLLSVEKPLVIDADGLNCLAMGGSPLCKRGVGGDLRILTPHPGEMSRLTGKTTQDIQNNRWDIARTFAEDNNCYLILKGCNTVIGTPRGDLWVNPTGNPGMATAGMGDVLTGMIASFVGQSSSDILGAVRTAVYLHGLAGDHVMAEKGDRGLVAGDVIEMIPMVLKEV